MLTIFSTRWSFRPSLFVTCTRTDWMWIVLLCAFIRVLISFISQVCDLFVHNGIYFFIHRSSLTMMTDPSTLCLPNALCENRKIASNTWNMDAGYKLHVLNQNLIFNWLTEIFHLFQIFFFLVPAFHSYPIQTHNSSVLSVAMWTMVFFRFPWYANVDAVAVLTHYTTIDCEYQGEKLWAVYLPLYRWFFPILFCSSLLCFYSYSRMH